MRTTHWISGMVFIVSAVFFSACSKKNEFTHLIPRDAALVLSAEPQVLIESLGGTGTLQELAAQTEKGVWKNILSAPGDIGIDGNGKAYLFASLNRDEPTLLLRLKNKSTLEQWLKKQQEQGLCDPLQRRGDFSWTFFKGQGYCAFTPEMVVWVFAPLVPPETVLSSLSQLLEQKEEDSFVSTEPYKELLDIKDPIAFYMSFSTLPNAEEISTLLGFPPSLSAEDLRLMGGINATKEKLALSARYYSEHKELNDFLIEQGAESHALSKEFLKYIPEEVVACFAIKLQGDAYSKIEAIPQTGSAVSMLIQFSGIDAEAFLNALDGDLTLAINNNVERGGIPSFYCYAETSAEMRQVLREGLRPQGLFGAVLKSDSPDNYSFSMREVGTIRFGLRTEGFYFMTSGEEPFTVPAHPLTESGLDGLNEPLLAYFYLNMSQIGSQEKRAIEQLGANVSWLDRLEKLELKIRSGNRLGMNVHFRAS